MKKQLSPAAKGFQKRQRRYVLTCIFLLLLTLVLAGMMMVYGNTIYSPKTVFQVLSGADINGAAFTIRTLRFPRMLTGILCGLAFGLAGNTFQKLLGNPLASLDIIGITSGASVAAVFGILVLKLNNNTVSWMAAASGLLVSSPDLLSFQGKWLFQCQADPHWYRNAGFSECGDFLDAFESFRI